MIVRWRQVVVVAGLVLAGCAGSPQVELTPEEQYEPETITVPPLTPLVEYPPIDPVEPPLPPLAAAAPGPSSTALPTPTPAAAPAPAQNDPRPAEPLTEPPQDSPVIAPPPVAAPATAPAEPSEDQQLIALLVDLQRYAGMSADDLRRELAGATAGLARSRTDANRVRLAVLYTLVRATPQDDQRAQQAAGQCRAAATLGAVWRSSSFAGGAAVAGHRAAKGGARRAAEGGRGPPEAGSAATDGAEPAARSGAKRRRRGWRRRRRWLGRFRPLIHGEGKR